MKMLRHTFVWLVSLGLVACGGGGGSEGTSPFGGGGAGGGGTGTSTVSFQGKTYYVCCSGCRDEFYATPAKYVAEFEKKRAEFNKKK